MLLVVHGELRLKLIIQKLLELGLILDINESVGKDTKDLVTPELDDLLLLLIQVLVSQIQSLEDLGDVSHIELVMWLGWGGEELILHNVEQVDGGLGDWLNQGLDLLVEQRELVSGQCIIDLPHVLLGQLSECDQVELGHDSVGDDATTSTWLTHGSQDLHVLHQVADNLLSVVPEAVVDPLTEQLERWLRSIAVFSWHVEVINEADGLDVGVLWLELVVGSLVEVALNYFLAALGSGSS